MKHDFSSSKSLQELEHEDLGEPNYDSYLVKTCHDLHRKPLIDFTVEDLRLMIGQGIGLTYLVPIALDRLQEQPLAEGDLYPGDLLTTVLKIDDTFWINDQDSFQRIRRILSQIKEMLPSLEEFDRTTVEKALELATARLLKK
jgi:hypothetical protein